jgi:hypothetical protein
MICILLLIGEVACYKSFQVIARQIYEFPSTQSTINVNKHTLIYITCLLCLLGVCETVNEYTYTYTYHYQHNSICIY